MCEMDGWLVATDGGISFRIFILFLYHYNTHHKRLLNKRVQTVIATAQNNNDNHIRPFEHH